MDRKPFLALPSRSDTKSRALAGLLQPTLTPGVKVKMGQHMSSLLALNFNALLCAALNKRDEEGYTHWVLHHADIRAPVGFLDPLIDELDASGADILSVVVPMQDHRGLTTTGVRYRRTGRIRRFAMAEIHQLPETFSIAHIPAPLFEDEPEGGDPDRCLLVNTGLLVFRLTDAWLEEFPGFTISDSIQRRPDGKRQAFCFPEDWHFSQWAHARGLSVMATRKVPIGHVGDWEYRNDEVWGTDDCERGDPDRL